MFSSQKPGLFQSTLPCGERPPVMVLQEGLRIVSIHAPVRGATVLRDLLISGSFGFNPRSRAGSDLLWVVLRRR